jgi:hypothetical protein
MPYTARLVAHSSCLWGATGRRVWLTAFSAGKMPAGLTARMAMLLRLTATPLFKMLLNECDRHPCSYLQNMERQFLSAFLCLCRLAVDKDSEISLLIFYKEIEILLVDFSLL